MSSAHSQEEQPPVERPRWREAEVRFGYETDEKGDNRSAHCGVEQRSRRGRVVALTRLAKQQDEERIEEARGDCLHRP